MNYKLYWFTGQAGAGKTTLAHELKKQLENQSIDKTIDRKYVIVDGDDIRGIFNNKDYSIESRNKQVAFVQKLCVFLIKNNIVPIVCMVSPFAEQREKFINEQNGFEIYVKTLQERGKECYHVDYYEEPNMNRSNVVFLDTDFEIHESMNTLKYILNIP